MSRYYGLLDDQLERAVADYWRRRKNVRRGALIPRSQSGKNKVGVLPEEDADCNIPTAPGAAMPESIAMRSASVTEARR